MLRRLALFAVLTVVALIPLPAFSQAISLTSLGTASTQNFDTLSNTAGSTTNNLTITGWFLTESGGGARDNEQYAVDTGASTTGDMYSYGAAASTERALGQLRSGTLIPIFGAAFTNNTGSTITSLDISYNGEEWRLGTAARTDRMDFQYSTNATDLVTGTWVDVNTLDFTTPDTATVGAKNGNAAADRTALGPINVGSLSIPNGATFWIRWTDVDATGADDGLAIDDFSLTPQGAAPNTAPTITAPANPITTVAQDAAPFTVGLNGSDDGGIYNWSATPGTGVSNVAVTAGQGTANVTYTVTLTAGYSGTATFTATLTDNVNTPANRAVNITVTPAPPPAPTGLAATAGTSHVALTWNTAAGATTYNVKRSTTSGTETTVASPSTNSYDDTTAVNGTQYFYVVSGVGAGGEGSNSSEVTATPLAAPTGLTATPGTSHVVLNWTAVTGATGYNVKRSTSTGTETTLASPATNTYDDTTAVNGTQYFYVVTATNTNGESVASSEVNATPATPGKIVISQVYGGAGCGTVGCSTWKNDYIELFNSGGLPVSVNGWSVQYGAATGTTAWQTTALPNVSIQPGQYFLVAEGAGANGVSVIPTPDATGTIAMSATAGKVAVVSSTVALNGACPGTNVVDEVGYGATANCSETAPAPAPSTTNAIFRASSGCTDANNNSTDFAAAASSPRNTATALHVCGVVTNNAPTITPPADPITTVTQDAAPFTVGLTGSDDNAIYNWSATAGLGITNVVVSAGQGTANVTYTVTLQAGFTGQAAFTATLTDNVNAPVNQVVHIQVNATPPPAAPTGLNATAGDSHVALTWNAVSGATSYNVKRGTVSGGPYSTINSPGTNSYDDTSAVNGTTYYYVVSAVGAGGEGANSSQVSATPNAVTPVPTGLTAVVSSGSVALSWNVAAGATSYNLKRSLVSGGPYSTINSPAGTTYTDTAVTNGTRYFYVVSAVGPSGESINSAEVHAKPDVPEALGIVISQVYGAGGNAGAVYTNDFIELFNRGNSTVDLTGWSVQYSAAAGSTWTPTSLTGTLAPGRHYLVGEGAGAGGTTPLPATDAAGAIALSGTAGKVALVSTAGALSGGCPGNVLDMVGYGSTATCFEGSGPTPNPSGNTNSETRASNGCVDTNNNAGDFTNAAATPRNTAAAATPCSITAIGSATPSSVASGASALLKVELPPSATAPSVTVDLTLIGGSASQSFFDNGTNGDVTAGDNIFSFQATVTASAGVKSLPVTANGNAQSANTTILLTVTPPLESIATVKVDTTPADTVPDRLNTAVLVRGVVTSVDFRGGAGIEYYIQDTTGGIDVFSTSDFGPFSVGTNVEVSGTLTQFNGLTEITPSSITTLPGGTLPPVTPQTVTLSQLFDGVGEPLEGKLVRIDDVTVTSGTFPASGASGNVTVTDASGSGTLRVDSDTDIDGTTAPGGVFSFIGLVSQSDTTNPFDAAYQVLPRSTADIIPRTPPTGSGAANPPSVPPGGTTLLTMTVTLGQNPPSSGVVVVANLSSIGLSSSQAMYDDGTTGGDVAPGDGIYSYTAVVAPATPLGPKTLPVLISDAQSRSSAASISLNIQSASAPPTPTNLLATPGNGQVALTWDASLGASGYNVKRALVTGGPYTTVAPNVGTNSYTDTSVSNGVRYYYVVSALSGANESGDSNEVNARPSAPPPAGALAKVYFVDIGQGAGTLIVSPTGKSLLIDGGPNTQGTNKIIPLLNTLGISTIDYTILTHYHIDHDGGLIELINANRVAGTAYDNGDAPRVQPPVLSNSTGQFYTTYINALAAHSGTITRQTITGGTVIDLGGGMKATCLHAGGNLLSGGNVYISNTDLNSESVSTLIEYGNFDFVISGDMTGGGQTTTAKTPDVETFVGQMARDVDFVQLDHHGSTTANGRRFLGALKAEGSLASVGATNTFGHPNRETANKYLNIPVTSGNTYGGEGVPPNPGNGPVFYQTDPSPATDNRCTVQGYSGADQAHAGLGTVLLKTDGTVSFSMESFDDGGVRIPAATHIYALDSTGAGITTNFPPTVIPYINPGVPLATDVVTVTALVNDREDAITSVTLNYSINGAAQAPVTMTPTGSEYSATIPPQPNGTRVDYTVTATAGTATTSWANGYFSGTTTIAALRSLNALGEPTYLEYAARVAGLATSTTGNFSSSNNDDYLDDGTGAINVSRTIDPAGTQPITAGTTYTVAGLINNLTGRFRLDVTPPFDGINKPYAAAAGSYNPYVITSTGTGTVTPLVRTIAQINADPEGHEAKLVQIGNCTVTSGTIPASGGTDAFLTISDGTGSIEMKVDGDGTIPGLATPAGTFTLKGIVSQDDFLRPFNTRYTIAPRDRTDLGASAGGPTLITIAQAREDVDATTGVSPGDYVPDRLGQQVKIRGVVSSVDFRGATGTEIYIQDATAGVDIFSTSINTTFNIGDNLEVTGTVSQFNGLTEIVPPSASDITVLAPGTLPAVNMETVTVSQFGNSGAGEAFEGKLVRVNNVTLVSPPATFAANTNYDITDGTGTVQIRIDSDTDIDGTAPPAGTFSIIGVLGQFDNASPFDSGYQLFPRIRATDFLPAVPAAASITATGGTPQITNVGTAFSQQLQATVRDSGTNPIEGIGVTFTAPASGASGTFANGTATTNATTNASGVATATVFIANGATGTYNVVASTSSLTANFSLTNNDPSATHFSVSAPASVTNGVPFNVTVTARDASNSTATGYVGTVHFTSSSAGTLPANYTFTGADAGVHTFSFTLTSNGSQSITATDTVTASITGTTNTTVNPPPATHFSVTAPASVTNGTPFNVTVTALDASNAIVTGYTGTVHFTSSSTGTLPSDYTFVGGDAGTHTFSVTLTQNGSQSITATDTVTASITGSANTTVNAAPATHFSVSAPASVTNGTPFNVTVTALDASNATVTGYTGTVHFTSSSTGTLPSDYTFVGGDAGTHTFSVTLTQNGAQSITATDTVTASITGSANTTVNAAPATHFSVSAPASVTNGTPFNVTVTALDASNATVTGYTGTVHFTSSSTGTLPSDYTFTGGDAGTHTFSVTLTQNGAQSITATDTVTASITGSANTTVNAAPATHFSVSAPASVTNGTPFNVTVTALDASNAVVTGYTGTAHFTSSSTGTLPSDYTFTGGDAGTHTFSVTLTQNGSQSVTATDTVTASITGTANTTVNAAPQVATHFSVTAPASVTNGTPFNVTVTALDASNAVVTGYTGTAHFTSSSTGTLPSDYTFTGGDAGTHTFSVTLTQNGAQSVTATDTVTASITGSANTTVNAAPQVATHYSVTAPASVTNGTPFNVTVTALDASNAVVTGYTGTAHFTSSSTGTLPSDYTFTGGDAGTHTFSVTLTQNGSQSVTATDTVTASITGTANTTVNAAPQVATHYSVTAPASVTNGTPFNVTVTALDASNATVTGYTGTVHFTSSSTGTLPANYTFTGGDAGTHTFSVTLTQNGSQSVTATDTVTASITGTANTTVNAPPATHFSVTAPANVTNGVAFNVTVTALDASNATVTGYTGTVHFTSTSTGTLPANYTFTGGDAGTHTFSVTLTSNGAQSITATDTVTASITGTANTTVNAPPATHFSVTAPANVTNGVAFNVTVTALDASNAVVTGYAGTVHFTSSSTGTLPSNYTFTGGDAGTHTFSVTLTQNGAQSITATDTVTASITGTANTTVNAAPQVATHYSVTAPASVTNGTPFNVTVTALDASNAVVTGYTGTAHFTSSSTGTLPANYTFTGGDAGTHTFSVTLTQNGAQSITATDTVTASITGTANVNVSCPAPPPAPVIVADNAVCASSTGNHASTASGAATYAWTITNGTITAGQGTSSITYTAGASGQVDLHVDVSYSGPCSSPQSADRTVAINNLPDADLPDDIRVCNGTSVDITATLSGTAPFTVHWADGLTQSGIASHHVTRTVIASGDVTYTIDTVTDAFCTRSDMHKRIRVIGSSAPVISNQSIHVQIQPGQTTTLNVVTPTAMVTFQWYEGNVGDTSTPVGTNASTFTTPPITKNTHYWVRLTTACGSINSQMMIVQVNNGGKSRAVGH